jgi:DNA-binding MarR family transcriptional regulator
VTLPARTKLCIGSQALEAIGREKHPSLYIQKMNDSALLRSFHVESLDIKKLSSDSLDVKSAFRHSGNTMAPDGGDKDHIDRFLETIQRTLPELDLEVEGIVDRISGLSRRLQRSMDETLAEFGLDSGEHKALATLAQAGAPFRSTPGKLSRRMELSSGAITNRLDRLEHAGLIRRLPDPDDRRGVIVELTARGRRTYEKAVGAAAKKEALIAAALTEKEKRQLNTLLRRLMLEFERRENA